MILNHLKNRIFDVFLHCIDNISFDQLLSETKKQKATKKINKN